MPTLEWIGKEKVINHHQDVPYRVLDKKYTYNGDTSENMIIHGDNLLALKSLLPQYEGRIDCIYIDPPYNTGNEKWIYNDSVNDPRIKKWLGEVVGQEGEDLSRHDKWLCMMYPRVKLLYKLLAYNGVIFISIDDNELTNLKCICDEIYGPKNFIGIFSWVRKKKGSFLSKSIRKMVEYVVCYAKNYEEVALYGEKAYSDKWQPIVKRTNAEKELQIPMNMVSTSLADGIYSQGFRGRSGTGLNFVKDFEVKYGIVISPITVRGRFVWSQDFLDHELQSGTKLSLSKQFGFNALRSDQQQKTKTPSTLINQENGVGTNEDATLDLQIIFNSDVNELFNYSKPKTLIEYLVSMLCHNRSDAIILDSFAGSGTTAHAVLNLNKQDGGNRKFILVEMMDYAETITAERVKRVIKGYGEGDQAVEGTGGDFSYYELGLPLFDETNNLNEDVGIEEIRKYVYYMETKDTISENDTDNEFFLGQHNGTAYYFYYDRENITTLNREFLSSIQTEATDYVIYADVCALPKEVLKEHGITFKKIPRDISRL